MAEEVGQAYVSVDPSLRGFSAKLRAQLAAGMAGVGTPAAAAGHAAGGAFGDSMREGIRSRLAGIGAMLKTGLVVGAAAAGAGLAALTGFGLKSAAALEQTQIGLESLIGSAEGAKSFLTELQQFAATTPFEFQGVAGAARRILAFGDAVGITREEVIPTLTTIGDLASVLGVGQAEIDGVVRALGQIASKGKVSQEELLQIAEQFPGFNANAAIAAATGLSVADSMEAITKGEVDATTGINALLAGMASFKGAAGAMEKQSHTLLGVFSAFKDTVALSLTNAFQPAIPAIKDALANLTPIIGAAFDQLGPALGGVLTAALPLIGQALQGLVPILTPILGLISGLLTSLGDAGVLQTLGEAFGALLAPLADLGPLLGILVAALAPSIVALVDAFAPLLQAVLPVLGELLRPLVPILVQVADTLAAILGPAANVVAEIMLALAPVIGDLVGAVGDLLAPILKAVAPLVIQLLNALLPLLPALVELAQPVIELVMALMPLALVIADLILALTPALVPLAQLLGLVIGLLAQKAIVPLIGLLADAILWLLKPLEVVIDALATFIGWLTSLDWGEIGRSIGDAFSTAWDAVSGFFVDVGQWFADLPGVIGDALKDAGSWLYQAGEDVVRGLWNGISSLGGWLWSKVRSFVQDNTVGAAKKLLGIASPSKVFAGIGENVIAGYVQGVEDRARSASVATSAALAPVATTSAGLPAARGVVDVRANDALIAAAVDAIRDAVRRDYGGDVDLALGAAAG